MKKVSTIFISLIVCLVLVFSFSGCKNSDNTEKSTEQETQSTETTPEIPENEKDPAYDWRNN